MEISLEALEYFARLPKDQLKKHIRKVRAASARRIMSTRPKFVEFTNRYGERRQAVRIMMTSTFTIKDPDENYCTVGYFNTTELVQAIAEGSGDFYGLR